jgi:hypothetical protein
MMIHLCLLLGLLLAMTGGCQSIPKPQHLHQNHNLGQAINPIRLKVDLRIQMDDALAEVIASSSEIAATHRDRRIREMTLRSKMRFFDAYLFILSTDDPRAAFLLEWSAIVQLRQYVTEIARKDESLTPILQEPIAIVKKLEKDIVELGYKHFPLETIDAAKDDIEKTASSLSWHALTESQATLVEGKRQNDLIRILKLPLVSVTGLGKVGDTPEAIHRFTNTANDFSLVIQHLPERTRWQLELLLLEMESSGPVVAINQEIERLDKSVREMGNIFKSLPVEVRTEFEQSLAATEKLQPEFRATLAEAQTVADSAGKAIDTAHKTTVQAQETATKFTEAAKALETTAGEVRSLLTDYKQIQQSKEPRDPNQSSAGIMDYQEAAESFTATAREIRLILTDLQKPLNNQAALRQVSGEIQELIDIVFWRSIIFVTIIFLLTLGYHLFKSRLPYNTHNL